MKNLVLALFVLFGATSLAQESYSLQINQQTFPVELGKNFTYITESGDSITFQLSKTGEAVVVQQVQNDQPFAQKGNDKQFDDALLSFSYPENYSIATTRPNKNIQQHTLVSGQGGGVIIQEFATINPSKLVSFMLSGLVTEEQAKAAKPITETIGGKAFKGLQTKDAEGNTVKVIGYGQNNKGLLIATIQSQTNDELLQNLFNQFTIKF